MSYQPIPCLGSRGRKHEEGVLAKTSQVAHERKPAQVESIPTKRIEEVLEILMRDKNSTLMSC